MIADIDSLDPQQLRQAVRELQEVVQRQARESAYKQAIIDKLTHENAVLKRLKFAAQSERFNSEQRSLLEETLDADLQAVAEETCGVQLQPLVDAMKSELLHQRVLHADETPVAMLDPGAGKTHRAYLWTYCSTALQPTKLVVFDFAESRASRHPAEFLGHPGEHAWRGTLVCDDYSGYKALFASGVTEAGCLAHARRRFHELWANHKSAVGEQALARFGKLYEVEREVADVAADERLRIRQAKAKPAAVALHSWLAAQRQKVPPGSATAKAMDYSLSRWGALTRYLKDGDLPVDNNSVENQIRPIAIGRNNWLFAGSLRAGKRAAAIMSMVHSARLNGNDPHLYLKDVLERLPTQPASRIGELLPHRWQAIS